MFVSWNSLSHLKAITALTLLPHHIEHTVDQLSSCKNKSKVFYVACYWYKAIKNHDTPHYLWLSSHTFPCFFPSHSFRPFPCHLFFPCHLHNFEQFLSSSHKTKCPSLQSLELSSQYCRLTTIWYCRIYIEFDWQSTIPELFLGQESVFESEYPETCKMSGLTGFTRIRVNWIVKRLNWTTEDIFAAIW